MNFEGRLKIDFTSLIDSKLVILKKSLKVYKCNDIVCEKAK